MCVIGAPGGIRSEIKVSMYSEAESQQALDALCQVLGPSETKLPIDKIFSFEQVHEGLEYLRHGPLGKVLVGPVGE